MANDDVSASTQRCGRCGAKTSDSQRFFTIKEVGDACGLPGPVIARLVPRTWVEQRGWMYTASQLQYAVDISADVLNGKHRPRQRFSEPQNFVHRPPRLRA